MHNNNNKQALPAAISLSVNMHITYESYWTGKHPNGAKKQSVNKKWNETIMVLLDIISVIILFAPWEQLQWNR